MHYLEKIKPSYFDLLIPLKKWKILNIKALKEEAEYNGSFSGLYKIITKLEKNLLIDSFVNAWSNEKYVYLMPQGIKALGEDEKSLTINRDQRLHDSLVSKAARELCNYSFIENVYLDYQTREAFPLLERVPDALVTGKLKGPFKMAIEVELTQKSQDRVKQILRTYSDSKVVNQVLYVTDKQTVFNAYTKYLNEKDSEIIKEKFLFLLNKDLVKNGPALQNAPVLFKGKMTDLKTIFESASGE